MKKIKIQSVTFNEYTDYYSFQVEPYSKLLDVYIINFSFHIVYELPLEQEYSNKNKTFSFYTIDTLSSNTIPFNYEYFKMIEINSNTPPSFYTSSSGSTVNISLSPLPDSKLRLVLFNEIKPLEENRDEKISSILE
jgi:hypothetical protein